MSIIDSIVSFFKKIYSWIKGLFSGKEPTPDSAFPEKYHTSQELDKELKNLCSQYPDLITRYKLGKSSKGTEIWAYIISSLSQQEMETKPASLVIGCHHGRECIGSEAVFYNMKYLLQEYSTNEQIKNYIDQSAIIMIPLLNPDGHDIIIRKNGNRVDLNRNYTFNWGGQPGCSHDPLSEIYCGPTQLSEIESQLINAMKIIEELFLKYKNIKCAVDIHSGADVILYPWGFTWESSPDDAVFKDLCHKMHENAEEMQVQPFPSQPGMALYPTTGTFMDHVYQLYHCISFVAEIYKGRWAGDIWEFFNPSAEDYDLVCHRTLPIILTIIEFAIKTN